MATCHHEKRPLQAALFALSLDGFGVANPNVQFAQLLLVHGAWGLCEQALSTLCFGEGNDVADGLGTGHQGDDAVQTEGQAAVRWRAILQSI